MLIFFFLLISNANAEAPRPPRADTFEVRGTLSYFSTDANYTANGSEALPLNGEFSNLLGDVQFTYDWRPDWRFYSALSMAKSESSTNSNMGVNEFLVGAQKWFELGKLDVVPQGDFVYPLWRVDEGSDTPLLGEGAMKLRAGSWVFYPQKHFKPFAYAGLEYRDEGRAYLIPYNIGVKGRISHFWLQGEFRGYERIIDDADTDNQLARQLYLLRADSGSMRYFSVNPSYSELALEGGTRYGDWGLFAGFSYSINGRYSADGWGGWGGISYSPKAPARPTESRDENFNIRNDKYDESVFRESSPNRPEPKPEPEIYEPSPTEPPPEEPYAPPVESPRSAVPPQKVDMQLELRRVPKKKTAIKKKKNLDKMMNDTENFLEKNR